MFLGAEVPYKAAKIIEKKAWMTVLSENTEEYQTLGNTWAQANQHDKAIPVLEKATKIVRKRKIVCSAGVYFDAAIIKSSRSS